MTARRIVAITALTLAAFAAPAYAQAVSSGQPVNAPILSPTLPANCPPGNPYQDPRCAHTTLPAPVVAPSAPAPSAPAPASPPRPGIVSGFSTGSTASLQKVVSYFQRGAMQIDTKKAFGFVLIPRSAVTEEDRAVQRRFCQITLAQLDYMAPEGAATAQVLMTYWPISGVIERWQIESAFRNRRCDDLIDWYDHSLARSIATKADIAHLSGPLLITWPSQDPTYAEERAPLIVDFAKADNEHATKALQYWFRQLNGEPELWTNRIREGTIRAELADAINDTAGVVLAVLHGKWDSVAAVSETP